MMGMEDKTLLCFCHWGRRNKVLPDGSISYGGGITDQVIAKTGIKYNDFVNAVFDRLGIDPSDKMLHFTVKFDRSELIRLRDQQGIDTLLQFNDDSAHVYASSLEKEPPYSRPRSGGMEKVEHSNIASDKQLDSGVLSKDAAGKVSSHQVNQEPLFGQNNLLNDYYAHRYKQLTSSGIQETFWTKCHNCNTRYTFYRDELNRAKRCKKCLVTFFAFDLGPQGAACTPKQSQPGGKDMPLKSKLPNQGTSRMTAGSSGFPTGSQQVAAPKSRKRFRNQTAESSERDDTSTSVETEDSKSENGNNSPAGQGI